VRWRADRRFTRGLRFRLTASYALFFTLVLIGVTWLFRSRLETTMESQTREVLNNQWAAAKGYLQIDARGQPHWLFDKDDPDEANIVEQIRHIYMLADARGKPIQWSTIYTEELGLDSPEQVRAAMASHTPVWHTRRADTGTLYMLRAGIIWDERHRHPYYVALGHSMRANYTILREYTFWSFIGVIPIGIFCGSLFGWLLAGRALSPVKAVARTAQRISGSNLSLRIPARGAGDELDFLIETFNRMIDRLEASFQQMRQFSTDVSHELRTPITAIRGQLEVALFTAETTEQYRDAMFNALQDIERLSRIVRALLLLSQAESGQLALQKAHLDLSEVAREIVEQFQIPADEAGVRLIAELAPECFIEADRVQIERMFSNLLSNAVKFTPEGGTVTLRVETLDPPLTGMNTRVTVSDTGIGIEPDFITKIFDPFEQANPHGMEGTGLGLSIVSKLVRMLGGTIDVTSTPGEGTTFVVLMPLVPATDTPAAPDAGGIADAPDDGSAAEGGMHRDGTDADDADRDGAGMQATGVEPDLTGLHVLLCEDNALNAEIARRLLESRGIEMTRAADGLEGVHRFEASEEGTFDLVLMDLRMPVLDGVNAARALRALDRDDARTVPIVSMTADAYEDDVDRCCEAGMDGHVGKPVDPARLFAEIARLCGR